MSIKDYATTLDTAWRESEGIIPHDSSLKKLEFILIESNHKTYKYILINGLLGAAAKWNNPLVLQAGSELERPWDARSVCHKVLVPFERSNMAGRLGSSNEPFLNKPARFPDLSLGNAVRGGKDRKALETLIEVFTGLTDRQHAMEVLQTALCVLRNIKPAKIEIKSQNSNYLIFDKCQSLLKQNIEGEVLLFCSGLLLRTILGNEMFSLQIHPSNQSGASSKEIADIDVISLATRKIVAGIEVKDKTFNYNDFYHAFQKTKEDSSISFLFISRQSYIDNFEKNDVDNFQKVSKYLIPIEQLMKISIIGQLNLSPPDIQDYTDEFLRSANPKRETINLLNEVFA
ncbi:restriction endonuclease, SacI family [Alphaproteobacteria bacterium]|nr:restriction endonuclease, SacI family [Alphaproteobacteria bacterium]